MKYVIASIKTVAQGKDVNALNNCLALLIVRETGILELTPLNPALSLSQLKDLLNHNIQQYGGETESQKPVFQKNQSLVETGEINNETADKLNSLLKNIGAFDHQTPYKVRSQPFHSLGEHFALQNVVDLDVDLQQPRIYKSIDTLQRVPGMNTDFKKSEAAQESQESISSHLLRLSIKDGEYTYAKADDIIMIESSDHLSIVHVAQQAGKVKTTLRNSCLKDFLLNLPKNYFLRVNRFCAINLNRLSGGSYYQQFFEFDYCIKVKPKHPLSHAVFNSIGK